MRADDVPVRDAAREADLALEPRERRGIGDVLAAKRLDRNRLRELEVERPVDDPHPATADGLDDLVASGELLSRLQTIAKLIIEVAQTGERDPETICALALSRLSGTDRAAC